MSYEIIKVDYQVYLYTENLIIKIENKLYIIKPSGQI